MSAREAAGLASGMPDQDWFAIQQAELKMAKGKKAPHLTAVGDELESDRSLQPVARARHSIEELERYATLLRIDCVRMLAVAKSGHLDSSLSAADVVAALYYRVLRAIDESHLHSAQLAHQQFPTLL